MKKVVVKKGFGDYRFFLACGFAAGGGGVGAGCPRPNNPNPAPPNEIGALPPKLIGLPLFCVNCPAFPFAPFVPLGCLADGTTP